jgi:hypothetical protein
MFFTDASEVATSTTSTDNLNAFLDLKQSELIKLIDVSQKEVEANYSNT